MMTNGRLAGHSVLVTGASSGIGLGIARKMAEEGAAVGINYRSHQEPAEKLAAAIRAWGGKAVAIGADVSKELDVHRLFEETVSAFGRMDVLVANSGLQKDAAVADMTLDDWRTVIDINLTGHELIPWAGHLNYAASKGGIRMMVQTLAQEVASDTIRVNAVAPGAIQTPINREAWETKEAMEKLLKLIPYRRIGEPEDVAFATVWLASDEADYVTGTTLLVDGGMALYPQFRDNG
jgi:glucose 1-dehydrogenase